jgi:hypothetical protein
MGLVQHAEQPKQQDDGDGDADQPEQDTTHRHRSIGIVMFPGTSWGRDGCPAGFRSAAD